MKHTLLHVGLAFGLVQSALNEGFCFACVG